MDLQLDLRKLVHVGDRHGSYSCGAPGLLFV